MKTTLKLDGKSFDLIQFSYSLQRQTDHNGRPAEDVRGGSVHFSVDNGTDDKNMGNTAFAQWITSPFTRKNGSIECTDNKGNHFKTIKFTDAHCVGYSESYNSTDNKPLVENIVISARKLEIGDAVHEAFKA